jgi:hypothetical protein
MRPRPVWTLPAGGYEVELRNAAEVGADIEAWHDLAGRAMESCLFAHPDVLLPALQHLPDGRQAGLLLVWESGRRLDGLFPVLMPRIPLAPGEVRLWRPDVFPVAAALLDRERPEAVLGAALSFCASRGSRCSSLVLTAVPAGGPLAASFATAAVLSRRRIERLPRGHALASAAVPHAEATPLSDGTSLRATQARTPVQVRDAVETFLTVDAAGAKAHGGKALIQDPGLASFVRTMTRQLARRGRCRVDLVRDGRETVAAGIVLESAHSVWLWRAAASDRPHVDRLAAAAAARARRVGKRLVVPEGFPVSSEAAAALGLEPVALADLLVSTRPGRSPGAAAVSLKARIDRRLRQAAAAGLQRLARA